MEDRVVVDEPLGVAIGVAGVVTAITLPSRRRRMLPPTTLSVST
ncbi:MAG TPA: hypothetical protein VFP80_18735 [Thermoanaerobaculia bacterium]|nr:hypothetical protein [Thermoanaerobaculia bacterium]